MIPSFPSPYFVLLMTHPFTGGRRHDFFVVLTTNPLLSVYLHNQKLGGRETEDAAPYWQPRAAAGPFRLMETAALCSVELVHGTRGIPSKIQRLEHLAKEYSVAFYSDAVTPDNIVTFLNLSHAPEDYYLALERIERAVELFDEYTPMEVTN